MRCIRTTLHSLIKAVLHTAIFHAALNIAACNARDEEAYFQFWGGGGGGGASERERREKSGDP